MDLLIVHLTRDQQPLPVMYFMTSLRPILSPYTPRPTCLPPCLWFLGQAHPMHNSWTFSLFTKSSVDYLPLFSPWSRHLLSSIAVGSFSLWGFFTGCPSQCGCGVLFKWSLDYTCVASYPSPLVSLDETVCVYGESSWHWCTLDRIWLWFFHPPGKWCYLVNACRTYFYQFSLPLFSPQN